MLGLKMATDPRWVNIVERNLHEILIDHAFCEQKAASNAISMIVQAMTEICQEEMMHFDMVHQKLLDRGLTLTFERKDPYVNDLALYLKRSAHGSKEGYFVDQMLFAAMIEARSCERFKILSEELNDEDLKKFQTKYRNNYFSFILSLSTETETLNSGMFIKSTDKVDLLN